MANTISGVDVYKNRFILKDVSSKTISLDD